MKTYEFSIIASGLDHTADDYETRFYDGACQDATVSFQRGHTILDFARDAASLEDAIVSAVEDAVRAGCKVERLEPDPLVSLADIASRTGMSRAAMTNYAKGYRGGGRFPAPTVRITSESPLWAWADVARWLFCNRKLDREKALEAETVGEANHLLEAGEQHIGGKLKENVGKRAMIYADHG